MSTDERAAVGQKSTASLTSIFECQAALEAPEVSSLLKR